MTYEVVQTEVDGTAFYDRTVALDGQDFRLVFKFNARNDHWYMDIQTEAGETIEGCEGIKLVQGGRPLHVVTDASAPKGAFYVLGPDAEEPGLFDLGNNSELVYIPEADLPP